MSSQRWWSGDYHFAHSNIINFCDRPYREQTYPYTPEVIRMSVDLVTRHNKVVNEQDAVWVLGDIAMGNTVKNLNWAAQCVGHKTLLTGNHDKNFRRGGVERTGWDMKYADLGGFETVLHGTHKVELSSGEVVLVSHFPYTNADHTDDRYASMRPADDGQTWLLHGHVHEKWRQRGRMINVGVDAWGGAPVSEDTILELIAGGPKELAPLPWTL